MSDLVKSKLSQTLRVTSLTDLVRARTSEEVYLLIDVSGSMDSYIKDPETDYSEDRRMRNGKSRIDALKEVVKDIRAQRTVKMIAFGGRDGGAYHVEHVPSPAGGTPLHSAIDLARTSKAGRCVVISDGCPDSTFHALEAAKLFGGKIDVVFIGNPGEHGEAFLKQLAESTGGIEFHGDLSEIKELSAKISGLLSGSTEDDDDDEVIHL